MDLYRATVLQRSGGTIRTLSGNHKISIRRFESIGEIDCWQRQILETECILAGRAVEMSVHVIRIGAGAILGTKRVFRASAFVVDLVDESMLLEGFQRSVECCPVSM